ncbi:vWA domain-containing protein [Limnoglobus roseus]|uniref:VWFA domain-containing protein n=1 Tax=Limnoglobus roseus TaxID=2598579 RepID=A0A5C1ABX7_9BACT|nr:VWA domain-containing protein [Limnoglobus roseus]QEL15302.1 hypothetical protein PX52LOC_02217 [Limnoglobus roseus]
MPFSHTRAACAAAGAVCAFLIVGCSSQQSSSPAIAAKIGGIDGQLNQQHFDHLQQENYSHVTENAFRSARQEPLSTFSADVNTASYSNVRRFLNEGKLPPKDAVLLAELVNYFPYSYPQPDGDDPVSLTLDIAPCPWQAKHNLVRIGVKAREVSAAEVPPRNLVFLIDTSGSMADQTRLPLVKTSLRMLIDQLRPSDFVSIVTYAGDAALKLPPTPGRLKGRIRQVVDALDANGSTNGGGGIRMAYDQARLNFIEGGVNRVILCTDGDFNVGTTSEGELQRLIEQQRTSHVFLTVLGFGMGNLKNTTLELLANHGNGFYAYIDSEAEAHKVFVEQAGTLMTVAKDVKFQVDFNPNLVSAYRLIGYENRLLNNEDFKNDKKDAGDMGSGHTVTALYEIVPVGVPVDVPTTEPSKYAAPSQSVARAGEWLTVRMRYKHPESEKSLELRKPLPADAIERQPGGDFRFAAAVAQFGLLLRDSAFKGTANYAAVLKDAEASRGPDAAGHRTEFLQLVRQAKKLQGLSEKE